MAMRTATAQNTQIARRRFGFAAAILLLDAGCVSCGVLSSMPSFSFMNLVFRLRQLRLLLSLLLSSAIFFALVNQSKHGGYKMERGDGCAEQAADDGAAKRSILFSAVAQPQ